MGNELVVEELKKLQQKLKDTIHRLENNDDDGDGIIDKGRITPDEKKQIEAIEYEIKDFKEANKKWFERVTLKYKPSDDNIHKHSQDENTRNQKEQEKKDAINNNKKYSNTSASVQSKTTLETKINAESIGVALTRSLTASFSGEIYFPTFVPLISLTAGFGLSATAKLGTEYKTAWGDGLSTEVKFGAGVELKGEVSFGILFAGCIHAKASPNISMRADLDVKVSVKSNKPNIQLGNLHGGIYTGLEFSLGPAGWIAEGLDTVYAGLSKHLSISYSLPRGEFLLMKSEMNQFRTGMFLPKDIIFTEGKTLIFLKKELEKYQRELKNILMKLQNGDITFTQILANQFNTISEIVSLSAKDIIKGVDKAKDAFDSKIKDLTIDSMTITLDDIHYSYGEEMDVTIDLKLKDDDRFYDDIHDAKIWVELYYGETKIDGAEAFCSFKIKRQFQDTCTIKIPKNLDPSWANDDEAPEGIDDYIPPSNYINEKWGVCVYINFNDNIYQQKEWENDNFFMWSA